jgi:hypothetical protein
MLIKKTTVFVKTETTQGSAATMAETDALLVENFEDAMVPEAFQRPYYGSSLDSRTAMIGKKYWTVKFRSEIKGGGTRGTAFAPLGACLQASGLVETATGGVSVVYAPTSAAASANFYGPGKACTIEWYRDGLKHVAAGCLCKKAKKFEAGKVCYFEFDFMGVHSAVTDASTPTATYVSTLPPLGVSAAFSLQTYSAIINALSIEDGNEIALRPSMSAATGILGFMITGRAPKGTVDPEMVLVATHDFWGKIASSAEGAMSLSLGSVSGNIIAFSWPKVQYMGLKYAERNGILVAQLDLQLNRSSGDDYETITFT